MRRVLLWMAGNAWLGRQIPRLPLARRAVRRFLAGDDATAALNAGTEAAALGISSLYTRLGEHLTDVNQAAAVTDHYVGVLEAIEERGLPGEISVKPSQLGLDLDAARALDNAERLAVRAEELGSFVWLDMESSDWTEQTVELYERLRTRHPNVGVCLQAMLRRTAPDLQRLLSLSPAIRLVKGAYSEPRAIGLPTRREVDANFAALAVELLAARQRGVTVRIALGTHDLQLIEQIEAHARSVGLSRADFEVQMLYGIRVGDQRRLAADGYRVRQLISYGEAWYSWYMRRLAERPANLLFALRQIVG